MMNLAVVPHPWHFRCLGGVCSVNSDSGIRLVFFWFGEVQEASLDEEELDLCL